MHVDLLLDPFGAQWADLRDTATVAIDAGFAGIWTYDHLDGRVYGTPFVLECWTVLSALAVAAPGVVLGPLVLNVQNRHPGVLATMAATLQEVSGGRLMLGLGAGAGRGTPYAREQEAVGRTADPDALRRAHVETCVRELRRLWHSPGFLEPDPEPPFVIGVLGPKMAELAGRVGGGFNTQATHPRLRELVEVARRRARARGPRSRTVPGHRSHGIRRTVASRRLTGAHASWPRSARTASSSTCRRRTTGAASPRRAASFEG